MKRSKYHYKVDKLRSLLTAKEQAAFDNLVLWNPTYASIQIWFAERGHRISVNAVHHWWRANYPDRSESKVLRGLAMGLEGFDKRPYDSVLRLVVAASQVLCDHITGKLTSEEPHILIKKELELSAGLRSLSMMSDSSKI